MCMNVCLHVGMWVRLVGHGIEFPLELILRNQTPVFCKSSTTLLIKASLQAHTISVYFCNVDNHTQTFLFRNLLYYWFTNSQPPYYYFLALNISPQFSEVVSVCLSLSLCEHSVCMYGCMQAYMCACASQRMPVGVLLSCTLTEFEAHQLARLAGKWTLRIYLSPFPKPWYYRRSAPIFLYMWVLEIWTWSCCLYDKLCCDSADPEDVKAALLSLNPYAVPHSTSTA